MDYEMATDKDWEPTLKIFSNLFVQKRVYRKDRVSHIGFESAANITDRSIPMAMGRSVSNVVGRSLTSGSVSPIADEERPCR